MKNLKEKLMELNDFEDIERLLEKEAYKLLPEFKKSFSRYRNTFLEQEELELLGFDIFLIKTNDNEKFKNKYLKDYSYIYDIYYKDKNIFTLNSDYSLKFILSIEHANKIITKEQFVDILIARLKIHLDKYNDFKLFVNSLVNENKAYYDNEIEENIKQDIIYKALEEAKRKGIIK